MGKKLYLTCVWLSIMLMLSMVGCAKEPLPDQAVTLKVMVYDKDTFTKEYGSQLTVAFPNVELQVIETLTLRQDDSPEEEPGEKLIKFIEQENPDLILLEPDQVMPLADKGKLLELDPVMKQENFDPTGIPENMMDYFRQTGNGTLYAIAPTYTPSVIYYNIDLFKRHHIEFPRNQMTWEELFTLAARFGQLGTMEKPIYGIADHLYAYKLTSIFNVAHTLNLSITDPRGEKLQFQAEGWKYVFRMVTDMMKNKALYTTDEEVMSSNANDNPFSREEVAMQVHTPITSKYTLIGESSAQLGVVTMPVNPGNPEESPFISLDSMYAINAASDQKQLAWKVLDYMIGPEMAKLNTQNFISTGSLPIRNAHIQKVGEWEAQPYVMLKPSVHAGWSGDIIRKSKISDSMKEETINAMENAVDEIVKNNKPVDEVLAAMQNELQAKLDIELNK